MTQALQWLVIDAESRAAKNYNDDAYGFNAQRLWVIDGATGISDKHFTTHISDAAWLAETTSILLQSLTPGPIQHLLQELEIQLKEAFAKEVRGVATSELNDLDLPCACLGLVQLNEGVLELACVGDICILIAPVEGPLQVFSDQASAPFADKTLRQWRQLLAENTDPALAWSLLRPTIRRNRASVNQPGGYVLIHPGRDWAHQVAVHQIPYSPGMRVLMASDGAWRLVDLFGVHDAASLLEVVTQSKWSSVLDDLRLREAQDLDCTQYLRVKPSDDATGLLAQLIEVPT
jgi:hypothetical protein